MHPKMLSLFSAKPPVSEDEFQWLVACFAWLHRNLGEQGFIPLLARPDTPELLACETAQDLFDAIRRLAGIDHWHCRLEAGEERREVNHDTLGEFSESFALGTFSVEGNEPVIRYDPNLRNSPDALTATLAHELAHLMIANLGDPPGGEELHEHATDCAAVYLGFGVFLANSARSFEQFQDAGMHGWRSSTSGYLSEGALVTTTALFVRLFNHAPELASEQFKPYLKADFQKALKALDKRYPDLEKAISRTDLSDWA